MKFSLTLCFFFTTLLYAQTSPDSLTRVLVQKEQHLVDAVGKGDTLLWQMSLHDSCIITVEDGSTMTKKNFVEEIHPLPAAYQGSIIVIEPALRLFERTAVMTFICDEHLEPYGQKLHTQYRQTDTWINLNGDWKLIAMQLFEIPKNPVPQTIQTTILSKYTGTYQVSPERTCTVTIRDGKLFYQKTGGKPIELLAETERVFFRNGDGRSRIIFDVSDHAQAFKMIERRAGEDLVWIRAK